MDPKLKKDITNAVWTGPCLVIGALLLIIAILGVAIVTESI